MLDVLDVAGQALARFRPREDEIDRRQHVLRRAEGMAEPHALEAALGRLHMAREFIARYGEGLGLGALERIDGLLLVTDREHGAFGIARSFAGEELVGKPLHHPPLVGARVLRLVEKDMVDALVELVVHPRARILPRQQRGGAPDQVVEVEKSARALEPLVARNQPVGDDQRGA